MAKGTKYVAREPDADGVVHYTKDEDEIWAQLYARQRSAIKGKACDEFLQGLEILQIPQDRVPQLEEISSALRSETGWEVARVPALIPFSKFFELLSERKFPAATFIRTREELNYLREPDIFHEIFGHTPMLTNKHFADFTHSYGELGLAASPADRVYLARMYWFTVEFGLIQPPGGALGIYGGGILSSIGETEYAYNSNSAQRKRFKVLDALRTPYRIDIMQPLYYIIEDLAELGEITRMDLMEQVAQARDLGLYAPLFEPKEHDPELRPMAMGGGQ